MRVGFQQTSGNSGRRSERADDRAPSQSSSCQTISPPGRKDQLAQHVGGISEKLKHVTADDRVEPPVERHTRRVAIDKGDVPQPRRPTPRHGQRGR